MAAANSAEFDAQSPYPVIDLMPEQRNVRDKGATMRLGAYPCRIDPGSLAHEVYGSAEISERHRHRYEVSNDLRDALVAKGLRLSGTSPDKRLVEIVELPGHPYFIGCQFHPELKSRPAAPHPLFVGFVKASLAHAAESPRKLGAAGSSAAASSTGTSEPALVTATGLAGTEASRPN